MTVRNVRCNDKDIYFSIQWCVGVGLSAKVCLCFDREIFSSYALCQGSRNIHTSTRGPIYISFWQLLPFTNNVKLFFLSGAVIIFAMTLTSSVGRLYFCIRFVIKINSFVKLPDILFAEDFKLRHSSELCYCCRLSYRNFITSNKMG